MANFLVILFCFITGYIFSVKKLVKKGDYKVINLWIINIGLPAVALKYIPQISWKLDHIITAGMPLMVFALSYIFFYILQLFLKFSKRTRLTLTIVSGLNNTSFIGFPLIISFFGEKYLSVGIVSDQVTFFVLSSFGILLASGMKSYFDTPKAKISFILKKLFSFPPLMACLFALLFQDYLRRELFQSFFSVLAATVSPLALFSIGMQLKLYRLKKEISIMSLALFFKLLLSPLLILLLIQQLGFKGEFFQVSVFEMAMPSLVASSIIIERFDLNVKLANSIIGLSILIGLPLSFLWYYLIVTAM